MPKKSVSENDEQLYARAVDLIRKTQRVSLTHIQRRMQIGYADASRLISLLEERGVIGPANTKGPREILVENR